MTRDEHLEWAKRRALEYVEAARYEQVATRYERVRELLLAAFTSLGSDLAKHPELQNHKGIDLGMALIMIPDSTYLSSPEVMKHFIEGFQ
ncbi:MAG: hypothetical protein DME26_19380 [Verrucomicrobia bacterium]|nr:MAG: hypothetical protein DME26_19380 [Verrucomicrobiota bacterium]